jgi:Protein of unknown function (DUF2877)
MTLSIDRGQRGVGRSARVRARSDAGPDIIVPILRSGILAREFCQYRAQAEIAAVFDRSFYLRAGDVFVCVGEPAIGNGPLTLIADLGGSHPLTDLGLCPDQPAAISERCITVGDHVRFTFERCVLWHQPRWPRPRSPRQLNDLCNVIAPRMTIESPADSLGRLVCPLERGFAETALTRIAGPRTARFESWLRAALGSHDGPRTAPPAPVADLVGLGSGLTPSGDDLLVGALALLDALDEMEAHAALARVIAALPCGSTSALSACLLRTAAAGHVGEHLHGAVSAVVSGAADQAIAAIRKIGHSSGWDMMAGMLTVLAAVAMRDSGESA